MGSPGVGPRLRGGGPLAVEIALHTRLIDLPHRDPADRFIAATALVNGLTLATSDKHLLDFQGIPTLSNH